MRKVLAALLFALTGACLTISGLALSNLFDDYKDSPDSMFIEAAAIPFGLALLFVVAGAAALRQRPR